jgi:hypothetical protein
MKIPVFKSHRNGLFIQASEELTRSKHQAHVIGHPQTNRMFDKMKR